jgi:hypothetical protein
MSSRSSSSLTDAQRQASIRQRLEQSAVWRVIHILGSLRLAMFLLLSIATAIGTATFMESKFTTEVARYYIYRAPWFNGWLLLLCLNLLCAALTRWPWQRKHLGFVITHAGIITLLVGAMFGRFQGFEAFVTLHKNRPPQNRLISQDTILTVQSARDGGIDRMSFEVEGHPPAPERPRMVALPDTATRLKVDDYSNRLIDSGGPDTPPGVALHFFSGMMKQNVDVQLLASPADARQFDFFSLARVELATTLEANKSTDQPFHETQVVLAQHPGEPVIDSDIGQPSGYQVSLVAPDANTTPQLTVRSPSGLEKSWPLADAMKKPVSLPNDPVKITLSEYWPDFDIRNGKPSTLSKVPRNPAALVRITGPRRAAAAPKARPVLRLVPAKDGKLDYQLSRNNAIYAQGRIESGQAITLGWADWQARLDQTLPHAQIQREWLPQDGPAAGVPGIHARLVAADGTEGAPRWIVSGAAQALALHDQAVRIGFGQKPISLPFSISLESFNVPRDEGTQTPADFISVLRFDDPTGHQPALHDEAHMNYPAMYPGGFWRSFMGWNYKFSQSSWNPEDLDETTLQVLYDPGWPLKWSGSLMICLGITTMFYFKPRNAGRPQRETQQNPSDPSVALDPCELATHGN